MPEQAILDLPIIQFELFDDSPERLHVRCIESYGLSGLKVQADAVFHFAASLWRYRSDQTLKQIVLLSSCYLSALSRHVAARRRVAAVRASLDENQDTLLRDDLLTGDEELAASEDTLAEVAEHVIALVSGYTSTVLESPSTARARLQSNLQQMGVPGWTDRLEGLAKASIASGVPHIDWSAPLNEVLHDLERTVLPESAVIEDHAESGLLARLQGELDHYRIIADRASRRLQQVDSERHELERLLIEAESGSTDRSTDLEAAQRALDVTLSQAHERLQRLEEQNGQALRQAQQELAELRAERDRLANELMQVLEAATDSESSREELFEHIETAAGDRLDAARALTSLTRRLEALQNEAENAAQRADEMHSRARQLEETVEELTEELSRSEERHLQALANLDALEQNASRSSEFESILTESEERLAATEESLAEAELKVDALQGQLEDRDYELKKALDRVEAQKKTIDSISVQLAEAETLTDEHDARIVALERENERLRRDLSDAQSRMLDARGDYQEAQEVAESTRLELDRLKQRLNEERGKSSEITNESVELRRKLRDKDDEIAVLKTELEDSQSRLRRTEQANEEHSRKLRNLEEELEETARKSAEARAEATDLAGRLKSTQEEAAGSRDDAERLTREVSSLRHELEKANAEYEAFRRSAGSAGSQAAQLRAQLVETEQQVTELREQLSAAKDLAADRQTRLEERAALLQTRIDGSSKQIRTLQEALEVSETGRQSERQELEALVEQARKQGAGAEEAAHELDALRQKLHESEAFLIKRQRDFEKTEGQLKSLIDEVRSIADLRVKYEKLEPGKKRDEIASQIGRRMDSLFAAAGKPINADRRTEKLVILTVKKTEEEIAAESGKPFVATNRDDDSHADSPSEDKPA